MSEKIREVHVKNQTLLRLALLALAVALWALPVASQAPLDFCLEVTVRG